MMTPLERSLRRITSSLDQVGQSYALVGGLAVSVRAEPRLTRDADLAVAVDADWSDATQAVDLIHERGYDRGRDLQASLIRLQEHGAY
jgi:hypothetical protein